MTANDQLAHFTDTIQQMTLSYMPFILLAIALGSAVKFALELAIESAFRQRSAAVGITSLLVLTFNLALGWSAYYAFFAMMGHFQQGASLDRLLAGLQAAPTVIQILAAFSPWTMVAASFVSFLALVISSRATTRRRIRQYI